MTIGSIILSMIESESRRAFLRNAFVGCAALAAGASLGVADLNTSSAQQGGNDLSELQDCNALISRAANNGTLVGVLLGLLTGAGAERLTKTYLPNLSETERVWGFYLIGTITGAALGRVMGTVGGARDAIGCRVHNSVTRLFNR